MLDIVETLNLAYVGPIQDYCKISTTNANWVIDDIVQNRLVLKSNHA